MLGMYNVKKKKCRNIRVKHMYEKDKYLMGLFVGESCREGRRRILRETAEHSNVRRNNFFVRMGISLKLPKLRPSYVLSPLSTVLIILSCPKTCMHATRTCPYDRVCLMDAAEFSAHWTLCLKHTVYETKGAINNGNC